MDGIDKLFQLKYLSLRGTYISKLPPGIVRLYGLETLDLRDTYIKELPIGIIELVRLHHLLIERSYGNSYGQTSIPNGIGNMRNLQVISGLNIIKSSLCAVKELGNLTGLEELHLQLDGQGSQEYKKHEEMLLSSLCKLGTCKLQSLRIRSTGSTPLQFLDSWSPLPCNLQLFEMITEYDLPEMPKWILPALTNLAYLHIIFFEATEEHLEILGELPALLRLGISFRTIQKERLTVNGAGFPCLKELYIIRATANHWESAIYLTFEEGALPKLEKLELPFSVSAAEAYGFYLGLGHLPCLREAKVTLCNHVEISYKSNCDAAVAIRNEAKSHPNHPRLCASGGKVAHLLQKEQAKTLHLSDGAQPTGLSSVTAGRPAAAAVP
ncbi:Disease resistance protein RPM1 [Hordeum vulgare]|nr:Disease resistance protein RPM1 [Hordeum vulgare]